MGLNLNVICYMLARQTKEKNRRKGVKRMILVEARLLRMINAHLDNSQMLQCSHVIHFCGLKDTRKSIHEHSVKYLSGYKECACYAVLKHLKWLNRQKFASLMSPGSGGQYLYIWSLLVIEWKCLNL